MWRTSAHNQGILIIHRKLLLPNLSVRSNDERREEEDSFLCDDVWENIANGILEQNHEEITTENWEKYPPHGKFHLETEEGEKPVFWKAFPIRYQRDD